MIMGAFWIALLALALVWPSCAWKQKPLGMRVLAGVGIFTIPFGIALIIDVVRGGAFVPGAGIVAFIAVTYFDLRFRTG